MIFNNNNRFLNIPISRYLNYEKIIFFIRIKLLKFFINYLRTFYLKFLGMKIGKSTLMPNCYVPWPHQVSLGSNCIIEHDIYFHFDGPYSKGPKIIIGNKCFLGNNIEFNIREKLIIAKNSLIGSGTKIIDHDHNIEGKDRLPNKDGKQSSIFIKENTWVGANVIILKGVCIGSGAVIGAGSVVTKSIPDGEIWAGVPAKKIGERMGK